MYDYVSLTRHQLTPFKPFIPQHVSQAISATNEDYQLIAFGAFFQNTPAAICLALLNTDLCVLEFLHLEAAGTHCSHELGNSLFAKVQEEAIKKGASIFTFVYERNNPNDPNSLAIEKIFKANQWKGVRPFLIRAFFNPETFDAPLLHLPYRYPPEYREFLWKDLSPSQRRDLLYREKEGHFSLAFSPFREEEKIEFLNSLGLENQGRVVGWLITHRIDPETIRYSTLYIEPSLKFRSLAMKLLADSIKLHTSCPTKRAIIEVPYLYTSSSWISFVKSRLLPSAVKVTYLWQGWDTIS